MIPVCIKKLHPDAVIPTFATKGSAGADIYAIKDITLFPNEIVRLSTGIALSITRGYEIQIRARSSMASKGIIIPNSPSTIDSDFVGEIKVLLLNLSDTPYTIKKGDRIAQMVIGNSFQIKFNEVEELPKTERGEGGFGSTGI